MQGPRKPSYRRRTVRSGFRGRGAFCHLGRMALENVSTCLYRHRSSAWAACAQRGRKVGAVSRSVRPGTGALATGPGVGGPGEGATPLSPLSVSTGGPVGALAFHGGACSASPFVLPLGGAESYTSRKGAPTASAVTSAGLLALPSSLTPSRPACHRTRGCVRCLLGDRVQIADDGASMAQGGGAPPRGRYDLH